MMQHTRVTVHLEPVEREFLTLLDQQRTSARAALAAAERDFVLAGSTCAAVRGFRPAGIGELSDAGLSIDLPCNEVSDGA